MLLALPSGPKDGGCYQKVNEDFRCLNATVFVVLKVFGGRVFFYSEVTNKKMRSRLYFLGKALDMIRLRGLYHILLAYQNIIFLVVVLTEDSNGWWVNKDIRSVTSRKGKGLIS